MEIVAVNPQATLLLSGDIDDWETLRRHQVDTMP